MGKYNHVVVICALASAGVSRNLVDSIDHRTLWSQVFLSWWIQVLDYVT